MNENNAVTVNEKNSIFTVKRILKIFSFFGIVFVFCPSFLVSCSGQDINVNVMTAVGGLSSYGERVVDPHPIMLICLLIPIAIFVLLFLKKINDKKLGIIILASTAVDLMMWIIFRATVKRLAEENYCSFKTTGWYVINIIIMFIVIILASLVIVNKLQMETDLIIAISGNDTRKTLNQMSAKVSQMSDAVTQIAGNIGNKSSKENTIGFCSKCGSPIVYGCKFCTSCGTPVPESMLAEAEAARKAAEEAARKAAEEAEEKARIAAEEAKRQESIANASIEQQNREKPLFCQQCGAKLDPEAIFCETCGTKVE